MRRQDRIRAVHKQRTTRACSKDFKLQSAHRPREEKPNGLRALLRKRENLFQDSLEKRCRHQNAVVIFFRAPPRLRSKKPVFAEFRLDLPR
jgi:hypothetical protein